MPGRVCAVYWSATGNTRKLAEEMGRAAGKALGCPVVMFDFTPPAARESVTEFSPEDLVIVGSPTYAGKLPNKILPDFQEKLKGNGAQAIAFVTYGNRSFDNSLAELAATLTANGFAVTAGAAFPCRHSFTDLLAPGRPDEGDLKAAADFAAEAAQKAAGAQDVPGTGRTSADTAAASTETPDSVLAKVPGDAAAPYYVPKGTDGQPAKFLKAKPLTDREKCNQCGDCVALCPVGSINPADVTDVPGICIKCQACIRGCHAGAKYFEDAAFLSHVAMLEQNFTERKEAEFFI